MHWLIFVLFPLLLLADPFLSFLVSCHNSEAHIEMAIESIYLQQNLEIPFEIVCADDASADNTYTLLCRLRQKHPEIRLFRHDTHRGQAACRNTCASHAKGDLFFCLDADNLLEPNSVQKLVAHHLATGADAVAFSSVQYFSGNRSKMGASHYNTPNRRYHLEDLVQTPDSPPWSGNYLYTKKSYTAVGGYPEAAGAICSYLFGFKQVANKFTLSYVPGTAYWHRMERDSPFLKECQSGRLQTEFYTFLLAQKNLFTQKSIDRLKKYVKFSQEGSPYDPFQCLAEKKIDLIK